MGAARPMGFLLVGTAERPFTFDAYWEYQEWIAAGLLAVVAVIGGVRMSQTSRSEQAGASASLGTADKLTISAKYRRAPIRKIGDLARSRQGGVS